jgi:signal transduction histidine kinase/ligand-binding sensor domain-containing protein/DNA-binding response OmpR family regulator
LLDTNNIPALSPIVITPLNRAAFFSISRILLPFFFILLSAKIIAQKEFKFETDQTTRFERINVDQGMSSNNVNCFHQDNYGFIWIGTQSGLNLYNGLDFKIFRNEIDNVASLPSDNIHKIFESTDSTIWICSEIGLSLYDRGSERFKNFFPDSSELYSSINKIQEIYEIGDFLVLNAGGLLYTFNRKTSKFQRFDKKLLPRVNDFIEPNAMIPDSNGMIWVFEDKNDELLLNHFDVENQLFKSYHSADSLVLKPSELRNALVYKSNSGVIWMATFGNGLYKLTLDEKGSYITLNYTGWEGDRINSNYTLDIFEDKESNVWFGGKWGFYKLLDDGRDVARKNDSINSVFMMHYGVRHFSEDQDSFFWMITRDGIFKYNPSNRKFIFFGNDPNNESSLSGDHPFSSYIDDVGQLWISTSYSGISRLNPFANSFSRIQKKNNGLSDDHVSSFLLDSHGDFWVGTFGGGLNRTPYRDDHKYENFEDLINSEDYRNPYHYFNDSRISTLYEDKRGQVWIGTYNGLYKYDRAKNQFIHYKLVWDDWPNLKGDIITSIYEDHKGIFWVASQNGLNIFDREKEVFHTFYNDPNDSTSLGANDIRVIYEDSENELWVGGKYLNKLVRSDTSFINFKPIANDPNSITDENIWTIIEGEKGILWLGSNKGLIKMNIVEESFISIGEKDTPDQDVIQGICKDKEGNLWISKAGSGISKYTIKSNEFRNFNEADGLLSEQFLEGSYYQDKEGWIYFGTRKGFNVFHPKDIKENRVIPPVYITELKLFGERRYYDKALFQKESIELEYDENEFSFDFIALNYLNSKKNSYAYKLEGYDEDWKYTKGKPFANYTNMSPGSYVFRVKASNNDGYGNEEGARLAITILPPVWKTIWAYFLYGGLIFLLISLLRRYELNRIKFKHDAKINLIKAEKLEELDIEKSKFFNNISHEFRTPLTLILGPLDRIIDRLKDQEQKSELNLVKRNAERLQNLISQLLSLAKLESGKMKLESCPEDIVQLTKVFTFSFHSMAENKGIEIIFESNVTECEVYLDRSKYEKICNNLLSNALKFTENGGEIRVSVKMKEASDDMPHGQVILTVSDSGIGISSDKLAFVFDRFYQVDEKQMKTNLGTGIGLALTKELVELHHGQICVKSELEEGTSFSIILPLGKQHLSEDEISSEDKAALLIAKDEMEDADLLRTDLAIDQSVQDEDRTIPLLLIVDDSSDMRTYIKSFLKDDYAIMEASNGKDGAEKAIEFMPDLIISDLMMPFVDGNEMTAQLKSDERTSHIPIILLTAKASRESKIEGLETGADDFLTKPFDADELLVRIKNLITLRLKLKHLLSQHIGDPGQTRLIQESSGKLMSKIDALFIEKAVLAINNHLSNTELNVEMFAREMGMSRMQLHRKLSSLTGNSSSELIRNIRLKKAAELLKAGELNVSEVTYEIGISSLSNFAKIFKEKYGVSPSEYVNKD